MSARTPRHSRGTERGASAVEFALVMPLLLFFILAIIGFGFMLSFRQGISQGAAEGARAAAVAVAAATPSQKSALAAGAVNDALESYGVTCDPDASQLKDKDGTAVGTCGVAIAACAGNPAADCASVTVDYFYRDHAIVPVPGLSGFMPSNLSYTAVAQVS